MAHIIFNAERLRIEMERRENMSQRDLETKTKEVDPEDRGVSQAYICGLLGGDKPNPSPRIISLLANALNIDSIFFYKVVIPHCDGLDHVDLTDAFDAATDPMGDVRTLTAKTSDAQNILRAIAFPGLN